tara:strand:+ start:587 stop:1012 length:426 start_codon:yes stop_codon:yes gene_type:complete
METLKGHTLENPQQLEQDWTEHRIYAQDQNSQIVWHSHELDNEHAKRIDSDHIPVIMEAAQLGEPKSKKATSKSRINTDILYEQETRREILKILTKQKKDFKICDRDTGKFIWETCKEHAYEYLIAETKNTKKQRKSQKNT